MRICHHGMNTQHQWCHHGVGTTTPRRRRHAAVRARWWPGRRRRRSRRPRAVWRRGPCTPCMPGRSPAPRPWRPSALPHTRTLYPLIPLCLLPRCLASAAPGGRSEGGRKEGTWSTARAACGGGGGRGVCVSAAAWLRDARTHTQQSEPSHGTRHDQWGHVAEQSLLPIVFANSDDIHSLNH